MQRSSMSYAWRPFGVVTWSRPIEIVWTCAEWGALCRLMSKWSHFEVTSLEHSLSRDSVKNVLAGMRLAIASAEAPARLKPKRKLKGVSVAEATRFHSDGRAVERAVEPLGRREAEPVVVPTAEELALLEKAVAFLSTYCARGFKVDRVVPRWST